MKRTLIRAILVSALLCTPALGADQPADITILYENTPNFPWVMPDGTGITIDQMKLTAEKLDVNLKLVKAEWSKCLEFLKANKVQGVLEASFKEQRKEIGRYPLTAEGRPDTELRLHMGGYSIYRPAGSPVDWDGKAFSGLTGEVGAQKGFSVVDSLKTMGVQVNDSATDQELILKKLLAGHYQAAALLTESGNHAIATNPMFKGKIAVCPIPFSEKPYYLMFSHDLFDRHPDFCAEFWKTAATVRDSAELAEAKDQFFSQIK